MVDFTVDEFKQALPKNLRNSVNPSLISYMATKFSEPDMLETYRENLIGYANVMRDGRFKVSSYVDAVKYVSHKVAGKTNQEAFSITFPEKIKNYAARGSSQSDISSYVSSYNKNKLVQLVYEQSMTPTWIFNQDIFQKAINHQAHLMVNAKSEKVQSDAANSLLTHLKPPEAKKMELEIGIKQDSSIEALKATMAQMAERQKEIIESGAMNAQEIAHQSIKVIDVGEIDEAEVIEQESLDASNKIFEGP